VTRKTGALKHLKINISKNILIAERGGSSLTLGCRVFFQEFLGELDKEGKKKDLMKIFENDTKWTAMMLGTGKSRKKEDFGLIGRIGQKFGYKIEAEWRDIDQIWYSWLPKPKNWKEAPWQNDVLVEHENTIGRLEYTLFKCEEISVPLKVCIFYPFENEQECLEKASEIIGKQVNAYPGGVYLIIFGFAEEGKGIFWHAYEIDFKGNALKLHEP